MRKKLMRSLTACALLTAVLMCLMVTGGMYYTFSDQLKGELSNEADTLAALLSDQPDEAAFLERGVYMNRVTLISPDGTVRYDSRHAADGMENHLDRTEIDDALSSGTGWAVRSSATLGDVSIYYAVQLSSGDVLRVAGTQRSVLSALGSSLKWLLLGAAVCILLAIMLARPVTRKLVAPINSIDLDHPLESDAYEELSPVLRRMDQQNARIAQQLERLTSQQTELNAILNGMREGLVILDARHTVLAMNPAAQEILGGSDASVGETLLAVNRHETLVHLLRQGEGEGEMAAQGRILRVSLSPVAEGGGLVLLFQDVTASRQAEEGRKQFSANVSHELRTPLTTISGYAEMLASGFSKPEDAGELGSKILRESRRLLSLIEDILRLSRMDEGAIGEMHPVELSSLARACQEKLAELATRNQVTLSVAGEPVIVEGDLAMLEEMLTNLMENGVKYNHAGGEVAVTTGVKDGRPFVTVKDNGAGIPPEHQERVFERFYRVDKSRSKQTGGTGLGLSIVKHGAQLHHADITLDSRENEGTTMTLTFRART